MPRSMRGNIIPSMSLQARFFGTITGLGISHYSYTGSTRSEPLTSADATFSQKIGGNKLVRGDRQGLIYLLLMQPEGRTPSMIEPNHAEWETWLQKWFIPLLIPAILVNAGGLFIPILEPDGSLYATIAKTMARTGIFISLYVDGKDWLDKPHFPFWMAALGFRVLLVSTLLPINFRLLFLGGRRWLYTWRLALSLWQYPWRSWRPDPMYRQRTAGDLQQRRSRRTLSHRPYNRRRLSFL